MICFIMNYRNHHEAIIKLIPLGIYELVKMKYKVKIIEVIIENVR